MKNNNNTLIGAVTAVLVDGKKLAGSCFRVCKVAWRLLPPSLLLALILVALAVLEREIEMGRLDSWI